jgi:membrane associated rhomboid family serine protease
VIVFGWQLAFPNDRVLELAGIEQGVDQSVVRYGAAPYRLTHPHEPDCALAGPHVVCEEPLDGRLEQAAWWLTPLTAMFMAGSLLQLAVNGLFLWLFGKSVEDALGRARFLALYLLAGIAGFYFGALLDSGATIPEVGASGAIAGLMGAYAVLYPRAAMLCFVLIPFFFTFVEIPALALVAARFALEIVPSIGETTISGVLEGSGLAYPAMVAGLVVGLVLGRPLARLGRIAARDPSQAVY